MSNLLGSRSYYKPFSYPWAFTAYEQMQEMHWLPKMAPLNKDVTDWNTKLTVNERNLLTQLFRFFTQGDVDVADAYRSRYLPLFGGQPELAMMLFSFGNSEANHVHSYSLLLDTIGMPETEYQAFAKFDEMRKKHEYLFQERLNTLTDTQKIALDIAVFSAFSEGMQLFSSFAMLLSFQTRGLMLGMTTIVEWSIRDESHHVENMIKLFHEFVAENPEIWTDEFKGEIYQTARDMVNLERDFIHRAFEMGSIEGLTPEQTISYVEYICDRRLNMLGLKSNYGIEENPLPWLDWIVSAPTHTNFFEQRSTEYSKGGKDDWGDAFEKTTENRVFVVYAKPLGECPYCEQAVSMLERTGESYSIRVLGTIDERHQFHEQYGTTTMPQVFVGHDFDNLMLIGGFDELREYLHNTEKMVNTTQEIV
jgi:ribonucleoside-diphosphate reductase beta chain